MEAHTVQEALDLREKGALVAGVPQTSDRRLYCQLQVFGNCADLSLVKKAVEVSGLDSVLYADLNDPYGFGILLISENPEDFIKIARPIFSTVPFKSLHHKSEFTMTGRTYSTGHEADLLDWLLVQPRRRALNPEWKWAIWYPLRRKPEFELLPKADQGKIIMEHAMLGRSYGQSGFAHDIRLACHGLDTHDNDFVIGLLGTELFPLSRIVQEMRKTQQTAKYLQTLGPFFVGNVFWQSAFKK